MNVPADIYEFHAICYEEGEPTTPPPGGRWIATSFAATQSSNAGAVMRCAWILWVREVNDPNASGTMPSATAAVQP